MTETVAEIPVEIQEEPMEVESASDHHEINDFFDSSDDWIRENAQLLSEFKALKCSLNHDKKAGRPKREKAKTLQNHLDHFINCHKEIAQKLFEKRDLIGIKFEKSQLKKFPL